MDFILYLLKHFKLAVLIISCICTLMAKAQIPIHKVLADSIFNLHSAYAHRLPGIKLHPAYAKQIEIAMAYFPELHNLKISFRVRNTKSPLATRPTFISMFRKKSMRRYIVTISKRSNSFLDSILLSNLSFNAQVGVLGHELSHIADFNSRNLFRLWQVVFLHTSKTKVDRFEYNTDKICIDHGLGFQLLSWSTEVREKLRIVKWGGANQIANQTKRERYMNPNTILTYMQKSTIYVNYFR